MMSKITSKVQFLSTTVALFMDVKNVLKQTVTIKIFDYTFNESLNNNRFKVRHKRELGYKVI